MLTQSEADALFAMPKKPKSSGSYTFSHTGSKRTVEFVSLDKKRVIHMSVWSKREGYPVPEKLSDLIYRYKAKMT